MSLPDPGSGPESDKGSRVAPDVTGRRPLPELLRWIGGHVRGFHAAIGVFLTLGLVLAASALILFAVTAALVMDGATQALDEAILLWFNRYATPRLDGAAVELTSLGSAYVTILAVIVASAFFWESRHRYSAALLWVALVGGWVLSRMLKTLFDRPRPNLFEWRVPFAAESSYPSGHSISAMAVYATLAYLVLRQESSPALKRVTIAVFAAIICVVGLSRVYLGVHYPADVVGGYLIGFAWATTCALGFEGISYFRGRRPEVIGYREKA
ncbi:MAG: phosphatase PAP2 family protein [Gemmatimonas sp.]|nr:phosphatase PAP2 family protein [Gemmatimonas sp.]